jgi:hypothetical protein
MTRYCGAAQAAPLLSLSSHPNARPCLGDCLQSSARRALAFLEAIVPTFTIETAYHLPIYRRRVYEAETLDEACRLAIEDDG